jgi:hypothetical protein
MWEGYCTTIPLPTYEYKDKCNLSIYNNKNTKETFDNILHNYKNDDIIGHIMGNSLPHRPAIEDRRQKIYPT